MNKPREYATIKISKDLATRLITLKKHGDTYEDVITRLLSKT